MTSSTTSVPGHEPRGAEQLPHDLQEAGFRPCPQTPPGFQGTLYMCRLPAGTTYVLLPPDPLGLIEAFVGDWLVPQRYFHGPACGLKQLLRLLSH